MTPEAFREAAKVDEDVVRAIGRFRDMVVGQNKSFNLVGPSFADDFWRRHALDSAQLFHVEQGLVWVDIGSGAGFPGIVLAIMMKTRPGGHVHLIESATKRARFLEAVRLELDLPATVHNVRAEAMEPKPHVDVVTARACAPLSKLFDFASGFVRSGATALFLKGQSVEDELGIARKRWTFQADLFPSVSDPTGRLLRIRNLAERHGR